MTINEKYEGFLLLIWHKEPRKKVAKSYGFPARSIRECKQKLEDFINKKKGRVVKAEAVRCDVYECGWGYMCKFANREVCT